MEENGAFDILNDINNDVTLMQLMETQINVNHAIIIVRSWIFDSNHENEFF